MSIPILGRLVDERFLLHRLKSTSLAGIGGGILAMLIFAYRFYVNHVWSWDLFAVVAAILVIKYSALLWFRLKD